MTERMKVAFEPQTERMSYGVSVDSDGCPPLQGQEYDSVLKRDDVFVRQFRWYRGYLRPKTIGRSFYFVNFTWRNHYEKRTPQDI